MPNPETIKDFFSLLEKSRKILIIPTENPSDDVAACCLALNLFLQGAEKETTIVAKNGFPERLSFLKTPAKFLTDLSGSRDFLLLFNTQHNPILGIESEEKNGQFIVRLTPAKGAIDPRDFSFVPADFRYDLLITVGAPALESLGKIHEENTDLFFEVPKINIDNHSSNENFGQVNAVDMTASSVSEICAQMLLEKDEKKIDQPIAQALLTGIVAATESFQKPTTTPRSMILAARLMKQKADQGEIIRNLYKTKALSFLKLWGRVMARMEYNPTNHFVWSLISAEDFVQSRASETAVPLVLEETRKNFIEGRIFGIFHNNGGKTQGLFHFLDSEVAKKIGRLYELSPANGVLAVEFKDQDLLSAEKDFLQKLENLE